MYTVKKRPVPANSAKKKLSGRRGIILVMVAVLSVLLLAMVTFSVDVGYMQLTRTELRVATDAAARAAAEALSREQSESKARTAAKDIALLNEVAGAGLKLADSDVVFGRSAFTSTGTWQFTAGQTPANAVRVVGKRTNGSASGAIKLFFGGIFKKGTFQPQSTAVASQLDRDIAVVVDHSGSMLDDNRWVGLLNGLFVFGTEIGKTTQTEYVSLSGYSTNAYKYKALTTDLTALWNALNAIVPSGNTNIGGGLLKGIDSLKNDPLSRPFAAKTIILLTDGYHNTGTDPLTAAAQAKAAGYVVHTISFGTDANQTTMKQIAAATGGKYFHAPDNNKLKDVFKEIALTLPVLLSQ